MKTPSIGFLGFGEVGQRFAADLRAAHAKIELATFDLLLHQAAAGNAMRRHAAANHVELMADAAAIADETTLIFSAVTADQTLKAARALAARSLERAWVIDVNSAAPETKIECAELVAEAGGRYVEAAVMTSVPPHGIRVPMLLGGAHAAQAEKLLRGLGFVAETVSGELGVASAIKLCRSVIIKGLESLVVESFSAARALGVEQQVLASLEETYPQFDWEKQGDYLFSRVIQHGRRRAGEMRASAQMIDSCGVTGVMALAAAHTQAGVAALREDKAFADPAALKPWRERADELLAGGKKMKSKTRSAASGNRKPTRPGKPGKPKVPNPPDPLPGTTKMPTLKKPLPWPPPKKERPR
jgi:3-hydroxyisobutyrate dehydrogenase-like beta-hydroxyacid dehydrogenase